MKGKMLILGLFGVLCSSQIQALNLPNLNDDVATLCASMGCVDYSGANAIESYADGTKIAAKDWGPKKKGAPTFLLIHGYPHGQGLWIEQVKSADLRQDFRLVTMDVRGSGLSAVPAASGSDEAIHYAGDIQAIIDRLGLKNVILVGHSYGGIVASAYVAIQGLSQIRGIVWVGSLTDLMNAVIPGKPPEDPFPGSAFDVLVRTLDANPAVLAQATHEFVEISHNVPFSDSLSLKFFNMDMDTTLAGRLGHITSAFANGDNTAIANAITVPNLIIQGLSDVVIPPVNSDNLQAKLTSSKKTTRVNMPCIGHVPMLESPAAFNKALAKFASGL